MNIEIQSDDEDIATTVVQASGPTAFIIQVETGGAHKNVALLSREMAKQLIPILSSFVSGSLDHDSDCALHNGPAEPTSDCTCKPEQVTEDNG